MIKKLNIKNFQSHKDTELVFHKGMNVIVGSSDSGKSAIIRALILAIKNKPGGDSVRSHWGGDTSVILTTKEHKIVRSKIKRDNLYQLDKVEFKAFGQGVPEEIETALNMEDINIQGQMDSPFLLSDAWTPGKIASHFNKIAKLDKIDSGLLNVQKQINIITQQITADKNTSINKKEHLKEFEDLDDIETLIIKVENKTEKVDKLKSKINQLTSIIMRCNKLEAEIENKKKILPAEPLINKLLINIKKKVVFLNDLTDLKKLFHKINKRQTTIEKANTGISAYEDISKLLIQHENLRKARVSFTTLYTLITTMQLNEKEAVIEEKSLLVLEKEYKRDFPSICPLCNTKIK